jgi:hypothetical protein
MVYPIFGQAHLKEVGPTQKGETGHFKISQPWVF